MVVDSKMIGHEGLLRRKHDDDCDWERLEGRVMGDCEWSKMIEHNRGVSRQPKHNGDWERLEGRVLATTAIGMNYGHKDDDEFQVIE